MSLPTVLTLTPNPALDITVTIDEFLRDTSIRIDTASKRLGGKGINVASVAAQQGFKAIALGPLAESTSTDAEVPFHKAFTNTDAPLRHSYAIHEVKSNHTTIINESGLPHSESAFQQLFEDIRLTLAQERGGILAISGSLPPGCPEDFFNQVIASAHQADVRVIADTSGKNLLKACKAGADFVKPNVDEIRDATGLSDPVSAAEQLMGLGAKTVLVSMGKDGLLWVDRSHRIRAKLSKQLAGNPTGAGDALVAALACSLAEGISIEATLERCVSWSAAAVLEPEAGRISNSWVDFTDQVTVEFES